MAVEFRLADAIRRRCASGDLNFIGIRHEGAASFAASAYAELSEKPAACLAIISQYISPFPALPLCHPSIVAPYTQIPFFQADSRKVCTGNKLG